MPIKATEKKSQGKAVDLTVSDPPFKDQFKKPKEAEIRHTFCYQTPTRYISSPIDSVKLLYLDHYIYPNKIKYN